MDLKGKAAIITGGARGVGKGLAVAFVKAGAAVMIVDREEAAGRDTEAELRALGGEASFLCFDLADHERLGLVVETAIARMGRLDTLVNAAQAAQLVEVLDLDVAAMKLPFDTGFWPTFLLMQAAFPHLQATGGSVINFGSGAAYSAMPRQAAYAAAKEAIRALSRIAAGEWGPEGVRVNVICPFANSPGVEIWREHAPADFQAALARVPLRRVGDCEKDIGAAAVFLASDAASYITGQTLMVDGGQTRHL
jgi:NAD(P)-dependent dehydrogenase (short-subunit alcohol dehydrogenase family)